MIELRWETTIRASAELVFSLLADLRDYDRWLQRSSAFHGTNEISAGPIAVGTTYVEPGPFGVRHGKVTEFISPIRLSFEQPMTMKPKALGVIGIRHRFTPISSGQKGLRCRGHVGLTHQAFADKIRVDPGFGEACDVGW